MINLCEKLLDTYNASILEETDVLTQALFYHYSSNNALGNKGNTILMDIIRNYYNNKKVTKPIITRIGGPISLSLQWSDKYNMCVYIFGEYHSSRIDCDKAKIYYNDEINVDDLRDGCGKNKIRNPVTKRCVKEDGNTGKRIIRKENYRKMIKETQYIKVENFLYDLFQSTPAFIDFYLETPGYTGQDYKAGKHPWENFNMRLSHLSTTFYECLSSIKRKDNPLCKLVRVHYLDIRKDSEMVDVNDVSYLRSVWHKINTLPDIEIKNTLKSDKRIVATIKKLITKDTEEYKRFWKEQLLQSTILKKEFSRTTLPKNIVLEFLETEIIYEAMRIREIFQHTLETFDNDNMDVKNVMYGISHTVSINSTVVDMYTITRLFKKFKNVKNQPESPRNIILYVGDAHATRCRKFLKQLDFKIINETGGIPYDNPSNNKYYKNSPEYNNCVDISNFKQPFFSEYPPKK